MAIIGIIVITSCAQPGTPETWVPVASLGQITGTWTGIVPTQGSASITVPPVMTMKYPDTYNSKIYLSQIMMMDYTSELELKPESDRTWPLNPDETIGPDEDGTITIFTSSVGNTSPYTQTTKQYMTEATITAAITAGNYYGLEINNTGTKLKIIIDNSSPANPSEIILIKK